MAVGVKGSHECLIVSRGSVTSSFSSQELLMARSFCCPVLAMND